MSVRIRDRVWSEFSAWCEARGLRALPAHPWTVAAYARWCETRHRFPIILQRIRAISRVHLLYSARSPERHPTVARTLRTLETRHKARSDRANLFPAQEIGAATAQANKGGRRSMWERRRERGLRQSPRLVARRPKN